MSINKDYISNLSKDKYTIKAESTATISFMGARPNYYKITNGGATPLYLGVSMMPTEDFFDMKIPSGTTKLYVDAYGHDEVYIYNPSIKDTNIIITSFTSEFNPLVLAMSDIGQDFAEVEFSGQVDATGNLKNILELLKDNVSDIAKKGTTTKDYITTIMNNVINMRSDISNMNHNISLIAPIPCTKFAIETNTDAEYLYTVSYINLLSNDGDSDMSVVLGGNRFVLKPNEVLTDIHFNEVKTIKIPKNNSFRLIGG